MITVTAAVIRKNKRILVARRNSEDESGGKWEFPGGRIKKGETPEACLKREILEELGIKISVGKLLHSTIFTKKGRSIKLIFFSASHRGGHLLLKAHDKCLWASPHQMSSLDFTPADRAFTCLLMKKTL